MCVCLSDHDKFFMNLKTMKKKNPCEMDPNTEHQNKATPDLDGSGHESAAVLSPGFAIITR